MSCNDENARRVFHALGVCPALKHTSSALKRVKMRALIFIFILIFTAQMSAAQTTAGSLKGQVTDPLGAIIVGANVTLTGSNGAER